MKRETIFCHYSKNFLNLNFQNNQLEINFTGTPHGNVLITSCDRNYVRAAKEFLNSQRFAYLKSLSNCLDLGDLEIVYSQKSCGESVMLLSKTTLPQKFLKARQVYFSSTLDLILLMILTNKNSGFRIEKTRSLATFLSDAKN